MSASTGGEPAAEVERSHDRLHRIGEERALLPPAGELLATAQAEERAEVEHPGDAGETGLVHHRGADLRQLALAALGNCSISRCETARSSTASPRNSSRSLSHKPSSRCSFTKDLCVMRSERDLGVHERRAEPLPRALRRTGVAG